MQRVRPQVTLEHLSIRDRWNSLRGIQADHRVRCLKASSKVRHYAEKISDRIGRMEMAAISAANENYVYSINIKLMSLTM